MHGLNAREFGSAKRFESRLRPKSCMKPLTSSLTPSALLRPLRPGRPGTVRFNCEDGKFGERSVHPGLGFAVTCELAAIPVDAEFIGGSVVALDELNPIAI